MIVIGSTMAFGRIYTPRGPAGRGSPFQRPDNPFSVKPILNSGKKFRSLTNRKQPSMMIDGTMTAVVASSAPGRPEV
jgi:hypothetical protein